MGVAYVDVVGPQLPSKLRNCPWVDRPAPNSQGGTHDVGNSVQRFRNAIRAEGHQGDGMPPFGKAHRHIVEICSVHAARAEVANVHGRRHLAEPRLTRNLATAERQRRTTSSSLVGRANTDRTGLPLLALTTQSIPNARPQKAATDASAAPAIERN